MKVPSVLVFFVINLHLSTSQDYGPLTAPTNGIIDVPATTTGSVATYTCDAGYTLSGTSTRNCDGTNWDGTAPTCAINDCGPLPNPTNGRVSVPSGTTYLQTATYSCTTGYDLNGGTARTCQADGTWSSTAPTCQSKGKYGTRFGNFNYKKTCINPFPDDKILDCSSLKVVADDASKGV